MEFEKRSGSSVTENTTSGDVGGSVVQAGRIRDVHISTPPVRANSPLEFLKAVIAVGALLGLTASSAQAGAVAAADPPAGVAAAPSPNPTTATTTTALAPTPAPTPAPVVVVTSQSTAEPRPATSAAAPTAEPEHRYVAAPDLTGAWQLDFTLAGTDDPDHFTITLKRLGDSKCVGNPPCYGGQWFHNGEAGGNGVIMWASPAPIGFTAVDLDQTYSGTVVEDDTRRPLSYRGTWTADGGKHATFVFTRVG